MTNLTMPKLVGGAVAAAAAVMIGAAACAPDAPPLAGGVDPARFDELFTACARVESTDAQLRALRIEQLHALGHRAEPIAIAITDTETARTKTIAAYNQRAIEYQDRGQWPASDLPRAIAAQHQTRCTPASPAVHQEPPA